MGVSLGDACAVQREQFDKYITQPADSRVAMKPRVPRHRHVESGYLHRRCNQLQLQVVSHHIG